MAKADLIQEIIENLTRCLKSGSKTAWQNEGLSHAQVGMLYMLFYHDEASPKQITDYLGISKSAVSQLMDPLIDKGFVLRRSDPKDRRIIRLSLSPSGKKMYQHINKSRFAGIRSSLATLSDNELEQLNEMCRKLSSNIKINS